MQNAGVYCYIYRKNTYLPNAGFKLSAFDPDTFEFGYLLSEYNFNRFSFTLSK